MELLQHAVVIIVQVFQVTRTNAGNNTISHNRAHDYKQTLNDGGGIYMLGPQNNSLIFENWLYDQGTPSSGALYPDEGSAYSTFRRNVVTNIGSSQWLHLWNPSIHNVQVIGNFADTSVVDNQGTTRNRYQIIQIYEHYIN